MGGLRDSLIGIEYINAKGERVKAGGKVVKNVTGYDLTRMMIGHLGGLGLITSVNFKVQPFVIEPHAVFVETGIQDWQNLVENLQIKRIPWIGSRQSVLPRKAKHPPRGRVFRQRRTPGADRKGGPGSFR